MELKESIMKQKEPTFMRNIKVMLLVLSVACIIVLLVLISQYSNYYNTNISHLQ